MYAVQKPVEVKLYNHETLFSWLYGLGVSGVKSTPKMFMMLGIQILIIFAVNIIFWWDKLAQFIPAFIKMPVVFLMAVRTGIFAKTLYWAIVFTFGKKLFLRIRTKGLKKAMIPILRLKTEVKSAFTALSNKALPLLLLGGGFGLLAANYLSSYRLSGEMVNKLDKYFVALLLSFTVSYLLGEGRKHWIFKFFRLSVSDLSRLMRIDIKYSDNHTYMIMSGFVAGLLLDAPLVLINAKYGGLKYIGGAFRDNLYLGYLGFWLGGILFAGGVLIFVLNWRKVS